MSVLLYGSETWVITKPLLKTLDGFHHRIMRGISKQHFRYYPDDDRWERSPLEATMRIAGLYSMTRYITRCHEYILKFVSPRPLAAECLDLDAGDGAVNRLYWWDQELCVPGRPVVEDVVEG